MQVETKLVKFVDSVDSGYWADRITAELRYLMCLSRINGGEFDQSIDSVIDFLEEEKRKSGAITAQAVERAEEMLSHLSSKAREYEMICVAHAHIDMNWMWRWDETVAVTLDTFQTMLDIMDEYPEFCFSQSQASVYKIVAETAPDMLRKIRQRVAEGRWEVTASTWVEADKNLVDEESMVRHILYTKEYLSDLLGLNEEDLNIDFEPDTFGHSVNVPEILTAGGVKYYYHCRGYKGANLTRWAAPSGREVIAYCEPSWYNASIKPQMVLPVPQFCSQYDLKTMVKVYGVGDHGGGPTRRDIERIMDMKAWPLFPRLKFGTLREFFAETEAVRETLPKTRGERNFIFTGCYSSQSRIKWGNATTEAALKEAEMFSAYAALVADKPYPADKFASAWEKVLFNQFHDILPGSGTVDTREYAMGLYQQALAVAGAGKKMSLRSIAGEIDTGGLVQCPEAETTAEGAGVGFGLDKFQVSQDSRGAGRSRIFHIFNPVQCRREEPVQVVLWDWEGDLQSIICEDETGNPLACQLLDTEPVEYWGHRYVRLLVQVSVPATGYRTIVVKEQEELELKMPKTPDPRLEKPDSLVLENELVRAEFDGHNCRLQSLVDKRTGEELIDGSRQGGMFRRIVEDDSQGMTAWRIGRYSSVHNLIDNVRVTGINRGQLRQSINYEIGFGQSKLKVQVSLDSGSANLNYEVECDWHEYGRPGQGIPQLNFMVPVNYECSVYKYGVPMGVVERPSMDMDVPGKCWTIAAPLSGNRGSLMLISDSKYGFRGHDNSLALTLLRSSFDPDPDPEIGVHRFRFAVAVCEAETNKERIMRAEEFRHPLTVLSGKHQSGCLPGSGRFMELQQGSVVVTAVKMPEAGNARELIVRLYETEGQFGEACLVFPWHVEKARWVDVCEKEVDPGFSLRVEGERVYFTLEPYRMASLSLKFNLSDR